MPPRLAVLAIVVFWLATTSWLVYREVLPEWRAAHGQPPTFTVDFLDEIGANSTDWQILIGEKDQDSKAIVWRTAGTGRSEVRRQPDRSFVYATALTFTKPRLLNIIGKIESTYRVAMEGKLLSLEVKLRLPMNIILDKAANREDGPQKSFDFVDVGVRAKVEDGYLKPSWTFGDKVGDLKSIRLPEQSGVLNPIQLGNKMTGLHAGQTWSIPLLNPLAVVDPTQVADSQLLAKVSEEALVWDNRPAMSAKPGDLRPPDDELRDAIKVPCFKIEFTKSGDSKPTATSWVRRRDGVVLQQLVTDGRLLFLKLIRGN